jgi:hypothetical protein
MAVFGVVLTSLLTASLINALQWETKERSMLLILERQKQREEVRAVAARMIAHFRRKTEARKKLRSTQQETQTVFGFQRWLRARIGNFLQTRYFAVRQHWFHTFHSDIHTRLKKLLLPDIDLDNFSDEAKKIDTIHAKAKQLEGGLHCMKLSVRDLVLQTSDKDRLPPQLQEYVNQSYIKSSDEKGIERAKVDSTFKIKTERKLQQLIWARTRERGADTAVNQKVLCGGETITFSENKSSPVTEDFKEELKTKLLRMNTSPLDWSRRFAGIHNRKALRFKHAAWFGCFGTFCSFAANEWLISGGSFDDEILTTGQTYMNATKAGNSISSFLAALCVLRAYYLAEVAHHLGKHVHLLTDIHGKIWNVGYSWLLNKTLWLEIMIILIHNPPYYTTSVALHDMGRKNIQILTSEVTIPSINNEHIHAKYCKRINSKSKRHF